MAILTGIDLVGIQAYVFATNRLRDVLAASWMVDHVTEEAQLNKRQPKPKKVLMAAGGNAILEFDKLDAAKDWTAAYTRWLLDTAPGLEVAVAHCEFAECGLATALTNLQIALARAKLVRRPSAPQLGLSVTVRCTQTGLPAIEHRDGELLSARVARLRDKVDEAKKVWNRFLGANGQSSMIFPDDLDRMGRSRGDTSLIGIVHVDGNAVGQAITGWLATRAEAEALINNNVTRAEYAEWSGDISTLGSAVLQKTIERVRACVRCENGKPFLRGTPHEFGFALAQDENSVCLPIRPVLLGGDDLTFLCDGRIALDLAATAVCSFGGQKIRHLGRNGDGLTLSACAGVAIVGAHAPFYRGYELAERLCHSAKRARLAVDSEGGWIDWHIGATRPGETVEEIRTRQYQAGSLTMRPYPVVFSPNRAQSWQWLDRDLLGPGNTGTEGFRGAAAWKESHGRVKRLATLAAQGKAIVKRQINAWQAADAKQAKLPGSLDDSGYVGHTTPLLDAIELLDSHMRCELSSGASGTGSKGATM